MNARDNKLFYDAFSDICTCNYCQFYIENIVRVYGELGEAFALWGIDIRKPLELSIPYLDKEKIIYPFAQYIVIGNEESSMDIIKSNLHIKKATSYPKIDLGDEYFVIEISDIVFDKSLASFEILQE